MEISNNICKTAEFEDSIYYEACCSCGSDHHRQTLEVECEITSYNGGPKHAEVSMMLYSKITTPEFVNFSAKSDFYEAAREGNYLSMAFHKARIILSSIWVKLKFTKDVWFNGYVQANTAFTFKNEAAINDYIKAIEEAKQKMLEVKNGV